MGGFLSKLQDEIRRHFDSLRNEIRRLARTVIPDRILDELHRGFKRVDTPVRDAIRVLKIAFPQYSLLFDRKLPEGLTWEAYLTEGAQRSIGTLIAMVSGNYAGAVSIYASAIAQAAAQDAWQKAQERDASEPEILAAERRAAFVEGVRGVLELAGQGEQTDAIVAALLGEPAPVPAPGPAAQPQQAGATPTLDNPPAAAGSLAVPVGVAALIVFITAAGAVAVAVAKKRS